MRGPVPRQALGAALLLGVLTACGDASVPYGFDVAPEQRFRLEALDTTEVDGEIARVERYADFRLAVRPASEITEIELYLERYYERVEGGPADAAEVAFSAQGIVVRTAGAGERQLGPDDPTPTAASVGALLGAPIESCVLAPDGAVRGLPGHSQDPLLAEIHPLRWVLLAFPVLSDAAAWNASRELPRIGRYQLGVQLPLRYERVDPGRLRVVGFVERGSLRLGEDLSGALRVNLEGEIELGEGGRVAGAALQLSVEFDAADGSDIRSQHRLRVRCVDCPDSFNLAPQPPDQAWE